MWDVRGSKFGIRPCQVSEEQLSSEFRAGSDQTHSSAPLNPQNIADENATLNAEMIQEQQIRDEELHQKDRAKK